MKLATSMTLISGMAIAGVAFAQSTPTSPSTGTNYDYDNDGTFEDTDMNRGMSTDTTNTFEEETGIMNDGTDSLMDDEMDTMDADTDAGATTSVGVDATDDGMTGRSTTSPGMDSRSTTSLGAGAAGSAGTTPGLPNTGGGWAAGQ